MGNKMDMMPADVLRAAADEIERRGWQQGRIGDGKGPCCAVGAIWGVDPRTPNSGSWAGLTAWLAAEAMIARQLGYKQTLATWNDAPGRTANEVIALLLSTASDLEARHAP